MRHATDASQEVSAVKTEMGENEATSGRSDDQDREWRRCRQEAAEIVRRIRAERERLKDLRRRVKERERAAGANRGWIGLGKLLDLVEDTWPGGR